MKIKRIHLKVVIDIARSTSSKIQVHNIHVIIFSKRKRVGSPTLLSIGSQVKHAPQVNGQLLFNNTCMNQTTCHLCILVKDQFGHTAMPGHVHHMCPSLEITPTSL